MHYIITPPLQAGKKYLKIKERKAIFDVWVFMAYLKFGMMKALWYTLAVSSVYFVTVDPGEYIITFNLTSPLSLKLRSHKQECAPYY